MSVGVPVNTSSSSQLPAATARRRVADSQEDHFHVSTGGGVGGGNAVVYVPDEEEATSCCSLSDGGGGGLSSCCPSGSSHKSYLVGFLSLRKFRMVWMLTMLDNKSHWTGKNMRSATNLGRVILSLLGILVFTFFLIVALSSGGRRRQLVEEKHEFVFSIHPRNNIEKIIREEESSIQLLLPQPHPSVS